MSLLSSMENFQPPCLTLSDADVPNSAHEKLWQTYSLCLRKNILLTFFTYLENFNLFGNFEKFSTFLATSLILFDVFGLFGYFLVLFGLVSPITCTEIPMCSCTENSAAPMCRVSRKTHYAACPRNSATMPDMTYLA